MGEWIEDWDYISNLVSGSEYFYVGEWSYEDYVGEEYGVRLSG